MPENKTIKFTCRQCGGNRLAYHEYVKSITPIEFISNEKVYYAPMIIDENDFVPELSGFCCGDCSHMLEHCGRTINTEIGLMAYLSLDSEVGMAERDEYGGLLIDQIDVQDEQEYD